MENLLKRFMMDGITDMVFVMRVMDDSEFVYEFINKAAEGGAGLSQDDIGKRIADVYAPEYAAPLYAHYKQVAATGAPVHYDDSYLLSGETYYSDTKLTPLCNDDGQCSHIVGVVEDVTDAVIAQSQLKEREQRFRAIAEYANDLITMVNDKGEIIYASPSHKTMLGIDYQACEGKFFLHNVYRDDKEKLDGKMIDSIKHGQPFTATYRQLDAANNPVWCQSHGTSIYDHNGKFQNMVIITRNISVQKEYEDQLYHFAHHDSLTGLPNRRMFKQQLSELIENRDVNECEFAVILMDIDCFKQINDQLGHDMGDLVIEEFGNRLNRAVHHHSDMIARLGGDEFVMLLSNVASADEAMSVVKDIQQTIKEPWTVAGRQLDVSSSMGIAMAPQKGTTAFSMLKEADNALYEAKSAGRNAVKLR